MIYLDNSATTRPFDAVIERMSAVARDEYFNPSALYAPAMASEAYIKALSQRLAALCGGSDAILTSGGTEANNLAILGSLRGLREPRRMVLTAIEHPAVAQAAHRAAQEGVAVDVVPVDARGIVRLDALEEMLRAQPQLVSVMHVNNEVGSVQPIEAIGRMIRRVSPATRFHVDGVQGFLRLPMHMARMEVDLYTVSAHKVHGPKGVGALVRRGAVRLQPILYGGGQQGDLRSGTENVPGIAGFLEALAVWDGMAGFDEDCMRRKGLLWEGLRRAGALVNGPEPAMGERGERDAQGERGAQGDARYAQGAPHILNVSFPGVRGEVLVHALEADGILVSTGAACSSRRNKPSDTLRAMGLEKERWESAIRLSLGAFEEDAQMGEAVAAIARAVEALRPFRRR